MAGSSRGERRRRILQARAVALLTVALTLSAVSSAIAARTDPSVDETLLTRQVSADGDPKPSKPPKPTKPPKPSPTASPTPEPSPTLEPSPSPSPDPTTSSPDPTPPSPPGTTPTSPGDDPTASEGTPRHGDTPPGSGEASLSSYEAPDPSGGSTDRRNTGIARDGTGSLFATVASIIDELAASDDRPIRAAEAQSTCPGFTCGSPTDAGETLALFVVLTVLAIVFAGVVVIRARSRRSTTEPPSDRP